MLVDLQSFIGLAPLELPFLASRDLAHMQMMVTIT
jgi:hypothetical protein